MGSIEIEGVDIPIYVIARDGSEKFVSVDDNSFTLDGGGRIYFAKEPMDNFSNPHAYWETPLLGYTFTYEIGNLFDIITENCIIVYIKFIINKNKML